MGFNEHRRHAQGELLGLQGDVQVYEVDQPCFAQPLENLAG